MRKFQLPTRSLLNYPRTTSLLIVLRLRLSIWEAVEHEPQEVIILKNGLMDRNRDGRPRLLAGCLAYFFPNRKKHQAKYSRQLPAMLQVNQEARKIALQSYQLCFSTICKVPMYFNFDIDKLVVHCRVLDEMLLDDAMQRDCEMVRDLVIYEFPWEQDGYVTYGMTSHVVPPNVFESLVTYSYRIAGPNKKGNPEELVQRVRRSL